MAVEAAKSTSGDVCSTFYKRSDIEPRTADQRTIGVNATTASFDLSCTRHLLVRMRIALKPVERGWALKDDRTARAKVSQKAREK